MPNFPPYTYIENERVLETPNSDVAITEQIPEGNWEARLGPMVAGPANAGDVDCVKLKHHSLLLWRDATEQSYTSRE